MLARIWWKEWRALAPIALTLAVALGALQWFLVTYGGRDIPRGVLVPIAVGWAVLYALVAGAASFAGERELRMMGFLDALPVGRGMLWLGKVTFVLGSSFLLGAAFRTVGAIGDVSGAVVEGAWMDSLVTPTRLDQFLGLLLAEAAVWGIFWSAISKNALSAGILAVITTAGTTTLGTILNVADAAPDAREIGPTALLGSAGLLGALLAASWVVINWERAASAFARRGPAEASAVGPAEAPPESVDAWVFRSIRPDPAFGSVAWQAAREGRALWLLATGIALAIPTVELILAGPSAGGSGALMVLIIFLLLVQGASVFGLENAAGTRPFLDNQAVSPRVVWVAKVGTWLGGLAISAALLVGISLLVGSRGGRLGALGEAARDNRTFAAYLMVGANTFAVGLLGGMMFPRRITALLLSGMAAGLVIAPQAALYGFEMIPAWSLTLTPAILTTVSFLWAGDWLAVRGDWRRWARLATLVTIPTVGLGSWYVAGRAWGIPDIGPQFLAITRPASTASGLNEDYRRAAEGPAATFPLDPVEGAAADLVDRGWAGASPEVVAAWQAGRAAIDEARRLAALPQPLICNDQLVLAKEPSIFPDREDRALFAGLRTLTTLLALDGIERRSRGDRAGAWEDILAQYRASDQAAAGASTIVDYSSAMRLAAAALPQALAWARDPALTRDEIRAARLSLQRLVLPPMIEVLRAESGRLEATLGLPTDAWVDATTPARIGRGDDGGEQGLGPALQRIGTAWFVVPAWERERTRRILRRVTQMAVKNAGNDWYESWGYEPFWPVGSVKRHQNTGFKPWSESYAATPMAFAVTGYLIGAERAYDRELTNRRALDTFLALRSWQIDHEGQAPAALDQLVPGELKSVPIDPFSPMREPLAYVRGGTVRDGEIFRDEPGPYYGLVGVGSNGRLDDVPQEILGRLGGGVGRTADDLLYPLPASIPPRSPTP